MLGDPPPPRPDRLPALLGEVGHAIDGQTADNTVPWAAIGPFRLSGSAALTFHGVDWEERIPVVPDGPGWQIDLDGRTFHTGWWCEPVGVWTSAADDEVMKVAVVEREDALEIAGHGGRWRLCPGPRPNGDAVRSERPRDGRIRAPMPATALRIHVALGDRVARGQLLVTLGAMKMELGCEAPIVGTVEIVSCRADDVVAADDVRVLIDESPDAQVVGAANTEP